MASMMRRRANSSRLRIPAWDRPKDEVDLRTKVRGKRVSCLRGANPSPQLLSLFLMTRDRSPRPGRAAHSRLAFREGIFDSIRDARRITIERRECLVSRRARGTPGWVVPNLESAKSTTRGDCAAKGGRCAPRRCSCRSRSSDPLKNCGGGCSRGRLGHYGWLHANRHARSI